MAQLVNKTDLSALNVTGRKVRPIIFKLFLNGPPLYKRSLWALFQMDTRNECSGFGKHLAWRVFAHAAGLQPKMHLAEK